MHTDTTILDANAVLRFLMGDIEEQAAVTKQTIAQRRGKPTAGEGVPARPAGGEGAPST